MADIGAGTITIVITNLEEAPHVGDVEVNQNLFLISSNAVSISRIDSFDNISL
jgi:hypothetical protein